MMNMFLSGFNRVFSFTAEDRASYPFGILILAEVCPDGRRALDAKLDVGSIQCLYDDDRTSEMKLDFEDYSKVEAAVRAYIARRGIPVSGVGAETCTIYLTIPAGFGMTFLAETMFESGQQGCTIHCAMRFRGRTLFSRSFCEEIDIKDHQRLLDWTTSFWSSFDFSKYAR